MQLRAELSYFDVRTLFKVIFLACSQHDFVELRFILRNISRNEENTMNKLIIHNARKVFTFKKYLREQKEEDGGGIQCKHMNFVALGRSPSHNKAIRRNHNESLIERMNNLIRTSRV